MQRLESTICANADLGLPDSLYALNAFWYPTARLPRPGDATGVPFPFTIAKIVCSLAGGSWFSSAMNGLNSTLGDTTFTGGRRHASRLPWLPCEAGNDPTRTSLSNSRSTGAPPVSCKSHNSSDHSHNQMRKHHPNTHRNIPRSVIHGMTIQTEAQMSKPNLQLRTHSHLKCSDHEDANQRCQPH
jgi:hypothetical protein